MLKGTLQQRYVRCGKADCPCMHDPARRHGPYYYLLWRQGGKLRRQYVRKPDVPLVRATVHERQAFAREVREIRRDIDQLCHAFTDLVARYQLPTRTPRAQSRVARQEQAAPLSQLSAGVSPRPDAPRSNAATARPHGPLEHPPSLLDPRRGRYGPLR